MSDLLFLSESLSAKDRKKLKDSDFGLPKQRKFPLHDKEHVKAAIKMFHFCKDKDKKELAGHILSTAKKYDIKVKNSMVYDALDGKIDKKKKEDKKD